jgi:hypothetical protein
MPKKTCILFTVVILLTFNLHVKAQDKITEAINKQLIALNI